MPNEEFFHHQLREEIKRERLALAADRIAAAGNMVDDRSPRLDRRGFARRFHGLHFFILRHEQSRRQSSLPDANLNARVDPNVSPNANISVFEQKEDRVTVLWVNGLESLPSDYAAK